MAFKSGGGFVIRPIVTAGSVSEVTNSVNSLQNVSQVEIDLIKQRLLAVESKVASVYIPCVLSKEGLITCVVTFPQPVLFADNINFLDFILVNGNKASEYPVSPGYSGIHSSVSSILGDLTSGFTQIKFSLTIDNENGLDNAVIGILPNMTKSLFGQSNVSGSSNTTTISINAE